MVVSEMSIYSKKRNGYVPFAVYSCFTYRLYRSLFLIDNPINNQGVLSRR